MRRALVVSAGTGVVLAGATLPAVAVAPPEDLGWSVTSDLGPTTPAPVPAAPVSVPVAPPTEPVGAAPPDTAGTGAAPAAPAPPRPRRPRRPQATVVVAAGDTLWDIAGEHLPAPVSVADVAAAWPAWYAANADVIGPDPDLIRPGQQLVAPTGAAVDGGVR